MATPDRVLRGRLVWFNDEPRIAGAAALNIIDDGAILGRSGAIAAVGEAAAILAQAPAGVALDDHSGKLILPGLIDTHIHYPQTRVIASYGAQLLEWLQKYTFVEEQKLRDPRHAELVARFFLDELARCGTTTAMVYCTVHPESLDAFFAESEQRGVRMIAGKVMMDRNAPEALRDNAQRGYDESAALIARWKGRGRLDYAVTPRFAVTSSDAQLEAAGALARENPDCYVQTHLSENHAEIALVKELFPWTDTYLHVYQRYGLLGPRSVFGHCIHLEPAEIAALAETRSVAAFCPTSNLFLGSGLFDMRGPSRP
jgi:guanine deaminase